MTSDRDYLYFSGTCSGGLWRVPLAVFSDGRAPYERAADITLVSPRPSLTDFDTLKGLTINRWDPNDDAVYATDPFHLQILRIDTGTGNRSGDEPPVGRADSSASQSPHLPMRYGD